MEFKRGRYSRDTTAEIRRHIRENPDLVEDKPEDPTGCNEEDDKQQDHPLAHAMTLNAPATLKISSSATMTEQTKAIEQMRKWGLHFDGKDAYSFLERIEELQVAYGFSDNQMLQGFAELLRDDAQQWFRNTINCINTLTELKKNLREFYIKPSELRHLDRRILERHQAPNEAVIPFVTDLCTLIRRHDGYNFEKKLDTLYYNAKAEYRLYLKRKEFTSINEFIHLWEEIDETQRELIRTISMQRAAPPSRGTMTITTYDRKTCCWRCKQRGPDRFNCGNEPKKFCSHCGKDDILSRDCRCTKLGNDNRAGPNKNRTRPQTQSKTDTSSQSK